MNTTLVILAAGLGSRYGGLKQMETIGKHGEIIADFSVYDAMAAGFNKIVYVIKESMIDEGFEEKVTSKIKGAKIEIAFQKTDDLPPGFEPNPKRERPWGTSHALWAARHVTNEPFMVISADDFYGRGVFESMHGFLTSGSSDSYAFAMPGHLLENTVSDHGSVSRAKCTVDTKTNHLTEIEEIRHITKTESGIGYESDGKFIYLPNNTIVNMLVFGFTPAIFGEIEKGFAEFLRADPKTLDKEYFLNATVKSLIKSGLAL
jgi:UTP-glucose-1-phosphate uridylyltransferase